MLARCDPTAAEAAALVYNDERWVATFRALQTSEPRCVATLRPPRGQSSPARCVATFRPLQAWPHGSASRTSATTTLWPEAPTTTLWPQAHGPWPEAPTMGVGLEP